MFYCRKRRRMEDFEKNNFESSNLISLGAYFKIKPSFFSLLAEARLE